MVGPVVLVRFGSPLMGWARLCLTYRAVIHQLNLMSRSQRTGICQLDLMSQSQFRNWLLYNSKLWTNQTSISNDCKTLLFRNKRWKWKKWNRIFDQTHKRPRCFFFFAFFFPSGNLAVSSVLDSFRTNISASSESTKGKTSLIPSELLQSQTEKGPERLCRINKQGS